MSNDGLMFPDHHKVHVRRLSLPSMHACETCLHIKMDVTKYSCMQRLAKYEAQSLHLLHHSTKEPACYGWPCVQMRK